MCGGLVKLALNLRNNQKKRSEVESGVTGDYTPTLKSKLGYLRFKSLQALDNGGFEVEETLVFRGVCVNLIKIKPEYLYSVPRVIMPPGIILVAFPTVMPGIFLFSCV